MKEAHNYDWVIDEFLGDLAINLDYDEKAAFTKTKGHRVMRIDFVLGKWMEDGEEDAVA
jgi:hypothetical protein